MGTSIFFRSTRATLKNILTSELPLQEERTKETEILETMGMKKRDIVAATCWVILGLTITLWSATFPFGNWKALGPAVIPFFSGLILTLLGCILLFQSCRQSETRLSADGPVIPRGAALIRVALGLTGMILSAVFLEWLGFALTVFCMSLFLLQSGRARKWRGNLFYAFVFTLGSYVLFQVLLEIALPIGFLGF